MPARTFPSIESASPSQLQAHLNRILAAATPEAQIIQHDDVTLIKLSASSSLYREPDAILLKPRNLLSFGKEARIANLYYEILEGGNVPVQAADEQGNEFRMFLLSEASALASESLELDKDVMDLFIDPNKKCNSIFRHSLKLQKLFNLSLKDVCFSQYPK